MTDDLPPEVERSLARLAQAPDDRGALAGLRDAFGAVRADPGAGPAAELARSAENLVCAQLDGVVTPSAETVALVARAARGLFNLDAEQRADLAERLDTVASGISDDPPPANGLAAPDATAVAQPPLLTVLEDGTTLTAGGLSEQAANPPAAFRAGEPGAPTSAAFGQAAPVASTTVAPQLVPELYGEADAEAAMSPARDAAAAIIAAAEQLDRHVGALVTIASGTDEVSAAVQQTAGEFARAAAEIKRHGEALAAWARDGAN